MQAIVQQQGVRVTGSQHAASGRAVPIINTQCSYLRRRAFQPTAAGALLSRGEVCCRMAAVQHAADAAATAPTAASANGRPKRVGHVQRTTKETSVEVTIDLDGTGVCIADTPVGFLNHMLDQISSHGLFDLTVKATGDTWIDDHHTVEDIALALGGALSQV
jgi:hypothetical protein